MKYSEINRAYTEKVSEYIAKGMKINTATMRGSQGEIASIDLTDGVKIYRILLEEFRECDEFYVDGIRLAVGISTDRVVPDRSYWDATVWNSGLEIIEEQKFYQVSERRSDFTYYGTYEAAKAATIKRHDRWMRSGGRLLGFGTKTLDITSDKAIDIAVPRIRKEFGVKKPNRKAIQVLKVIGGRDEKYRITYYSKTISLGC